MKRWIIISLLVLSACTTTRPPAPAPQPQHIEGELGELLRELEHLVEECEVPRAG